MSLSRLMFRAGCGIRLCRSVPDHCILSTLPVWHKNWFSLFKYLSTRCRIPSFNVIGLLVPKKKIFEGFYNIWVWKPSWSSDPKHLNKFSSQHHMEAPYEIWLQMAQYLFRKRSLKMLNLSDREHRSVNHRVLTYLTIHVCTNFRLTGFNIFLEIYSLTHFPIQKQKGQISPCCKIGLPRVISWINLLVLE